MYSKIPNAIHRLMNHFRENGTEEYNMCFLKIIQKPGKNEYLHLNNWRPISLINTVVKLFESILYNRLVFLLSNNKNATMNEFVQGNAAYQAKSGTNETYRQLGDIMKQIIDSEEEEKYMILSLDMSAAFDVVERDFMEKLLRKMGVPEHLITALFKHYGTVRARIKGHSTPEFLVTGVSPEWPVIHPLSGHNSQRY